MVRHKRLDQDARGATFDLRTAAPMRAAGGRSRAKFAGSARLPDRCGRGDGRRCRTSGVKETLNTVWGADGKNVWIAGEGGALLKRSQ